MARSKPRSSLSTRYGTSAARYVGLRSSERSSTRSSSSPYADERAHRAPSFSYVSSFGRSSGSRRSRTLCCSHESKWMRKRSSDASILCSISGTGSPDVAAVAVRRRLLAAPNGVDGGAEAVHLAAGVVVVVLAAHVVPGELEQTRNR